ncbi:MAG TPA: RraA family protein [Candidatus Dormibacteraeota bacterium]|jgi:4-hydroxy-4-methyl-2-oxoglutarate aldolase|nr:RraA family protein [Candidatus Dormibacteraeota bacterium]
MIRSVVDRLKRLNASSVSDALDAFGIKGVALGIHCLAANKRVAGTVLTVRLKRATREKPKRHLGTIAIAAASAGDVIVIEHAGRTDVAGWGGILSLAAKQKGVSAVIIDGAFRDQPEAEKMRFPVFGRTSVPVSARGRVVESSFNAPVKISGIQVRPEDFVLADGDGVVFVPKDKADEVITRAEEILAKETEMAKAIRRGKAAKRVMGSSYESLLRRRARS